VVAGEVACCGGGEAAEPLLPAVRPVLQLVMQPCTVMAMAPVTECAMAMAMVCARQPPRRKQKGLPWDAAPELFPGQAVAVRRRGAAACTRR